MRHQSSGELNSCGRDGGKSAAVRASSFLGIRRDISHKKQAEKHVPRVCIYKDVRLRALHTNDLSSRHRPE